MAYISPTLTLMIGAVKKTASALGRDFNELEHLQNYVHGDKGFAQHSYDKVLKTLREELGKIKADLPIMCDANTAPASGSCFAICPIDGFANFAHGNADFSISVALVEKEAVVAAVVYSPIMDELFFAEKGGGAFKEGFRNHERLRVASCKNINNALIACSADSKILKNALEASSNVRISGVSSLDLARLAAGKTDAVVVTNSNLATLSAGVLLVKEAGGYVFAAGQTDTRSENIISATRSGALFATNEALKQKIALITAK